MLLSVIIPVYNVEEYLDVCLNSVVTQINGDCEIILVDDGSQDASAAICDKYSEQYSYIQVIHKENGGLSSARNMGINIAEGEYLLFIDSDDFIKDGTWKSILDVIHKYEACDFIMCSYFEFIAGNQEYHLCGLTDQLTEGEYYCDQKAIALLINNCDSLWPVWKVIVKSEFIKKNEIYFLEGFMHEDVDWVARIFCFCKRFAYVNLPYYVYRQDRIGSIMHTRNAKSIYDTFQITKGIFKLLEQINFYYSNELKGRLSQSCFTTLSIFVYSNQKEQNDIIDFLKQNQSILRYSRKIKHKVFFMVSRMWGIDRVLRIYERIIKVKAN